MTASRENLSERWADASDKEEGGGGYALLTGGVDGRITPNFI